MVGMSNLNKSFVCVFKNKNWMMLIAFAFGLILQLFVIEVPGVQEVFKVASGENNLDLNEWLITIGLSIIPLIMHEIFVFVRFIKKKIETK